MACWWALGSFAQREEVRVGILTQTRPQEVLLAATRGNLSVSVDGGEPHQVGAKDAVRINVTDGRPSARTLTNRWPAQQTIRVRTDGRGAIRLSTLGKPAVEREFPGAIVITIQQGALLFVNEAPIEDYVAGVVRSEAGENKGIEYYKLQATICRTYALTNARRHLPEGFGLCDGTHCQVYKGVCRSDTLVQAVQATRNMVVVDAGIRLVHSTFHSNCGGETMNAEDLWSKSEPYLVSTLDPYCAQAPHATWRKTMPRTKWLDYLRRSYGMDTSDSAQVRAATDFDPHCRAVILPGLRAHVPLEQVRADMKFNSAFFRVWPNGDEVVFDGRGFGHGVGLCQEGAMRMARLGIPFTDILHHYFAEVHLVDLHSLDFFRDEGR